MTRDELRRRMLDEIDNRYDKSAGSFFYDAIDPVAIELEDAQRAQEAILTNAFVLTSGGVYLDRKCAEIGIVRRPATKATGTVMLTGSAGVTVAAGSLIASARTNYALDAAVTLGAGGTAQAAITCTEYGAAGNVPADIITLFPVTIAGITAVTNPEPLTNGYDAEEDESLRARYLEKMQMPATSGNAAHYRQWARSVTGVGDAKVFPLWAGAGTVKLVIVNANRLGADSELIADTAAYIEQVRPIGATVTVESAEEKEIGIAASIVLAHGTTLGEVVMALEEGVAAYFREAAFVDSYISYARVGSILYGIYGVEDYAGLTLNGGTANIPLAEVQVPKLGDVMLT